MTSANTESHASAPVEAELLRIERLLGADPAAAERLAAGLLARAPGLEAALLFQGIARRLCGNAAGAVEVLGPLAARSPSAPLVHLQLGIALRESGRDAAAATSLRRAVSVKPDYGTAWLALADLLTSMGEGAEADRAFCTYVKHAGSDPQLMAAATAVRERRTADAVLLLNRLLERHPNDVAALCMLAEASMQEQRAADAEMLLARCLQLAPGYDAARQNHAVVLMRQDKLPAAMQEIDRLLAAEPDDAGYRNLKAAMLARLGEYEQALAVYREVIDGSPDKPRAWANLGHVLRTVGRREECIEAYRKAIELAPDFGEAWWNLANLKTLQITDTELQSMQKQIGRPALPDPDRVHFHFAIGKALEDREQFGESFRHYAEGNRIRRGFVRHEPEKLAEHVQRCKAVFDAAFFAERRGYGTEDRDPIFIIGLPRVGSTLVEQILASHSAVEGTKELVNLSGIALSLGPANTGLTENRYPEVLRDLPGTAVTALGRRYIDETRAHRNLGRPFFIDKMPNNFSHIGFIHLILPNARIIDVRRHPMACGWSLFKHLFARGQNFSYSLEDIAAYYRNYVEQMAHFDSVLPGRVHRVHYESLVDDTEGEVRRMLEYCGLGFEESCLRFHETRRAINTPSSEQVRSRIFRDAVDHWRNYEEWLGPLRAALGPLADDYPVTSTR